MLNALAKRLKDVGFPNIQDVQHRQGREFLAPDGHVSVYSLGQVASTEDWFIPTLSELIEACGKGTLDFDYTNEGTFYAQRGTLKQFGRTPFEAVALLWLALNTKA